MEDRSCPMGCAPNDEIVMTSFDRLNGLPGRFTMVRCKTCGLMRTNPRPDAASIGYYYPDDYSPYVDTRVDALDESSDSRTLRHRIRDAVPALSQVIPPMTAGQMLEIGCASGAFLHKMALRGWAVEGIEPNRAAAEAASRLGYPVHNGTIESAPEPAHPYDLIVGWMVLEHLHEPVDALCKLHRWTRPGGWLAISVAERRIEGAADFRGCVVRAATADAFVSLHARDHDPPARQKRLESGADFSPAIREKRRCVSRLQDAGLRAASACGANADREIIFAVLPHRAVSGRLRVERAGRNGSHDGLGAKERCLRLLRSRPD